LFSFNLSHIFSISASLFGLLGRIPLSGVVIGADPSSSKEYQLEAARRAFIDRCQGLSTSQEPLEIEILEEPLFRLSKSVVKHRYQVLEQEELALQCLNPQEIPSSELKISRNSLQNEMGESLSAKQQQENGTGKRNSSILQGDSLLDQPPAKKPKLKKVSPVPYGNAVNWHCSVPGLTDEEFLPNIATKTRSVLDGTQEVTIAHTGLPQGKNIEQLITRNGKICCSRLSPHCMDQLMRFYYREGKKSHPMNQIQAKDDKEEEEIAYQNWLTSLKMISVSSVKLPELNDEFYAHRIFRNWIHSKEERKLKNMKISPGPVYSGSPGNAHNKRGNDSVVAAAIISDEATIRSERLTGK
jgi:hypothetical protein